MKLALLSALLPSIALGQAAPWLKDRCTNDMPKHPQMVDVPPTADAPVGGWLMPDPLVCGIDKRIRELEAAKVQVREVEKPVAVQDAKTLLIVGVVGILVGAVAGVYVARSR